MTGDGARDPALEQGGGGNGDRGVRPGSRRPQTPGEELANTVSHGLGFLLSLSGGAYLVDQAVRSARPWGLFAAAVFSATMWLMYLSSTVYHALPQGRKKQIFRWLEHCAIFLLIAGTYTPVALVALGGAWGWTLLGLVWFLALVGIVLKTVATAKRRWLPGLLYLGLGWIVVIAFQPLSRQVPLNELLWLFAGGLAYTVGLGFYSAGVVPYFHFIWHLFVMAGTACHVVAVWKFLA